MDFKSDQKSLDFVNAIKQFKLLHNIAQLFLITNFGQMRQKIVLQISADRQNEHKCYPDQ